MGKADEKPAVPDAKAEEQTVPSINTTKKTWLCVIALILAVIVSFVVLAFEFIDFNIRRNETSIEEKMVQYSSNRFFQNDLAQELALFDGLNLAKDTDLTASVIRRIAKETGEKPGVQKYGNGCIFRYNGKKAEFPKGLPGDLNKKSIEVDTDQDIGGCITTGKDDPELADDNSYCVTYSKLYDDLYYMEWETQEAYMKRSLLNNVDWNSLTENLVDTYDIDFVIAGMPEGNNAAVENATGGLNKYHDLQTMGLDWDKVKWTMEMTFYPVVIDGKLYIMKAADTKKIYKQTDYYQEQEDDEKKKDEITGAVIALLPIEVLIANAAGNITTFLLLMLMLCIALVVWTINTYRMIIEGGLDDKEVREHSPESMRGKAIAFIIISTLIVGAGCMYAHSLNDLFRESRFTYNALNYFTKSMDTSRAGNKKIWAEFKNEYVHHAEIIAASLDENPEIRTNDWLQEAADTIGADYIMLYDTKGNEMLTSSRYRNMSLGKDESSATYDFRRLLKGVRNISHEKVKDEVTGLTRDMYGISLKYVGGEEDGYGALIIAVDPDLRQFTDIMNVNVMLKNHTLDHYTSFGADPENGDIKYSSDETLVGENLLSAGFDEKNLKSSFIGFFDLKLKELFGRSAEDDGLLYYYASDEKQMYTGMISFTAVCMVLYLFIIILIVLILLWGFDDKKYDYYLELDEQSAEPDSTGKKHRVIRKIARAIGMQGSPIHRTMVSMLLIAVLFLAFMIIQSLIADKGSETANTSVIRYVLTGDWERGFNVFSATAVFFVACVLVLIEAALYLLRVTLRNTLDARGKTISALITSLLQYIALATAVFIMLGYFGVDYKAMLASVGIISMAISFGAKDFVADIFAGANLLLDNTYQMGDIVEINGYTGTIQEVTLRTTKIIGSGGNIKTIRNSDISNVVNLSAMDSWYPMQVVVSSDQDLKEVEAMLKKELPTIRKKHPEMIISGPEYRGIEAIGGGKITILLLTECSQEDYYKVQRIINKEVLNLFRNNDIQIL